MSLKPTIANVANNNIINAVERNAGVIVSGTKQAGSVVTLNGLATVEDSPTIWSITLSADQINAFGQGAEILTAIAIDALNNTATATKNITVDTIAPTAATFNVIANDNIVNITERDGGILVSGGNEVGAKVTLNGLTTSASTTTTWSILLTPEQINAFGQGSETLKAVSTDLAGNKTASYKTISIDTVAPTAPAINPTSNNNFINALELGSGVDVTGTKQAGSSVTLNGLATTALTSTTWSYHFTKTQLLAFGEGTEALTAIATDLAGNTGTSSQIITVDTIAPAAATFNAVATDNKINAPEHDAGVLVSGTKEAGSTIKINGHATIANSDTTWSYLFTPSQIDAFGQGSETLKAVATDAAGNKTTSSQVITIDTHTPKLVSSAPFDNSIAVPVDKNIELVFSEVVKAGTGNIIISNGAGDTRTIAVNDAQVTFNGNRVTINPLANLAIDSTYFVQMAKGVIVNSIDNGFAGISNTTQVNFSTAVSHLSALNGNNGFKISGEAAGDRSGISVSNIGDFNHDGYEDMLIGAKETDANGLNSGAAYIVFGKAQNFSANVNLADLTGNNGFKLSGISATDFTGAAVSAAGDINGDGYGDVIIGAYGAGSRSGSSYVIFGKASGLLGNLNLSSLSSVDGFKLTGAIAGDYSGASVSHAGDINGDGFDDLIIGAFKTDANGNDSGVSYVVFGKSSGFSNNLDLTQLNGTNGFKLTGNAYDFSGKSVSSAGDVNGDGYADLIIGAYGANSTKPFSGAAYIVFGKTQGFSANLNLSTLDGTNGYKISGENTYDFSGSSVSSAGDINGDGFDDLIIGAYNNNYNGAAYVIFGKANDFQANLSLSTLNGSNGFKLSGSNAEYTGRSVSGAGDVNGDGFDDLIIGANKSDINGTYAGISYVVFGKASGFSANLNLSTINSSTGLKLTGVSNYDQSGRSVSSAGDINGDGFDDLMVGSFLADANNKSDSGASYVIFGGPSNNMVSHLGTEKSNILTGTASADSFVAGQGNDFLIGKGGADSFRGGAGDDKIILGDLTFKFIDGGTGNNDSVALTGGGNQLNLANFHNKISNIETINITGDGNNSLTLTALELLDLSETTNTLKVIGNKGDTVSGLSSGWTDGGSADGYHTYTHGQAILLVGVNISTDFA